MKTKKRKRLQSNRQRFEILKRDGFTCQYCGRKPPEVCLEVDHIVAFAEGGGNDDENLITSCQQCNGGKSNLPIPGFDNPADSIQEDIESIASPGCPSEVVSYADFIWTSKALDHQPDTTGLGVYWCDQMASIDQKGKFIVSPNRLTTLNQLLDLSYYAGLDAGDVAFAMHLCISCHVSSCFENDLAAWRDFLLMIHLSIQQLCPGEFPDIDFGGEA